MKKIYKQLWELAKPYYEKCRVYDIEQIEWMMPHAEQIADEEGFDKRILLPIVIPDLIRNLQETLNQVQSDKKKMGLVKPLFLNT